MLNFLKVRIDIFFPFISFSWSQIQKLICKKCFFIHYFHKNIQKYSIVIKYYVFLSLCSNIFFTCFSSYLKVPKKMSPIKKTDHPSPIFLKYNVIICTKKSFIFLSLFNVTYFCWAIFFRSSVFLRSRSNFNLSIQNKILIKSNIYLTNLNNDSYLIFYIFFYRVKSILFPCAK